MSYRGRLIWPFLADIARLDIPGTQALPGEGGVTTGYDPDFREPVLRDGGPDEPDIPARAEIIELRLPCQIHTERGNFDALSQRVSGPVKQYNTRIILHYVDLEARNLIDTDGSSLLKLDCRLIALRRVADDQLVREFVNPQIFCVQAQDRSFGLSGLYRNLLMLYFEERETSPTGG